MLENAAILRDVLNFWTFQHQKRHNFARLPQFLNLTTSKTTQFCETSFKNGKLSAELTASYQCVLRFFHSTCLKYFACHEKVMPGHTKCCTCHAKSSQRSDAPKCNPSQEISARTSQHLWWRCLLYCACHATCIFADLLQMSHACHRFWKCYETLMFFLTFDKVHNPLRLPRKTTSERRKVLRTPQFFTLLTSKCASRHNGVHFFDISTSKSVPNVVCFCTFWLGNVLRATTACTFSTSQFLKATGRWAVLYIFTWKCASRHNGVQFFVSHLARWLRTHRFSEPTFRHFSTLRSHKSVEKHSVSWLSYLFHTPGSSFFWLFFDFLSSSSLTLPISAFSSVHMFDF